MAIITYLLAPAFWVEFLQNLVPVWGMVETLSIINHKRGYDVPFVLPLPRIERVWVWSFLVLTMIVGALTIEMTEHLIVGPPMMFLPDAFVINTLSFSIFGALSLLLASHLPAQRWNWSLGVVAVVLGFLTAWIQDFPYIGLGQAMGIGFGAAIFFVTMNRGSLLTLPYKLAYTFIINVVISLMIFHLVYAI